MTNYINPKTYGGKIEMLIDSRCKSDPNENSQMNASIDNLIIINDSFQSNAAASPKVQFSTSTNSIVEDSLLLDNCNDRKTTENHGDPVVDEISSRLDSLCVKAGNEVPDAASEKKVTVPGHESVPEIRDDVMKAHEKIADDPKSKKPSYARPTISSTRKSIEIINEPIAEKPKNQLQRKSGIQEESPTHDQPQQQVISEMEDIEEDLEPEVPFELPDEINALQIHELCDRMKKAGISIAPKTSNFEQIYKKKLFMVEQKNIAEYGVREELSPLEKMIYDISHGREVKIGVAENEELEKEFNARRKLKCETDFFVYFLLDPRKIKNLKECTFEEFKAAILYNGKGTKSRPLDHLKNAALFKQGKQFRGSYKSEKLNRIVEIWNQGRGVMILHGASYISEEEALLRESAIIIALEDTLSNERMGKKITARRWPKEKLIKLGLFSVYNAWLMFKCDRKFEISESNLKLK